MKKEIAIDICSIKPGKLPSKPIKCVVCDEECYFSGFGNEDFAKFQNNEYVDIKKYELKIVCTDCMYGFFEKQVKIVGQLSGMPDLEKKLDAIVEATKRIMKKHLR